MSKDEIEKLIEDKVMKGGMDGGLYDTGLSYVLVNIDGDDVSFRWFDHVPDLADYIDL